VVYELNLSKAIKEQNRKELGRWRRRRRRRRPCSRNISFVPLLLGRCEIGVSTEFLIKTTNNVELYIM
jgi:hypothetical protein